jgi:uncharacterized protein (DUF302 family)
MSYYFNKNLGNIAFEKAIEKVTGALKQEGFGVITEIDVKDTLKKKIDVDFRRYTILGACHPQSAYEALQKEQRIGVFLPCNVVVEETETGDIEVTAVDPMASMISVNNKELGAFAVGIQDKIRAVLNSL